MLAIHNAGLLADQSEWLSAILSELRNGDIKNPNLATKRNVYISMTEEGNFTLYESKELGELEGRGRFIAGAKTSG